MWRACSASVPPRRARRRQSSTRVGRGNLGAGPKPPHSGSKPAGRGRRPPGRPDGVGVQRPPAAGPSACSAAAGRLLAQASARRSSRRTAPTSASACSSTWSRSLVPGVAQRLHDAAERRHPVALHGREVGPGVEGPPVGRAEDRHGPAARPGQGLGGRHVDGVEVGTLLAVDLDRDERLGPGRPPSPGPRSSRGP